MNHEQYLWKKMWRLHIKERRWKKMKRQKLFFKKGRKNHCGLWLVHSDCADFFSIFLITLLRDVACGSLSLYGQFPVFCLTGSLSPLTRHICGCVFHANGTVRGWKPFLRCSFDCTSCRGRWFCWCFCCCYYCCSSWCYKVSYRCKNQRKAKK